MSAQANGVRRSRKRRGRGESAIYEKTRRWTAKDAAGKPVTHERTQWVAVVSAGMDAKTGKRARTYLYGDTKSAVQAKLLEHLVQHGGRRRPTERVLLAAFVGTFLEDTRANLSANTARSYEQTLAHVLPRIGGLRVDRIDAERIETLYAELRREVSASMLARIHVVLRRVLNVAKRRGLIQTSPLESVEAPRFKNAPVTSLTLDQVKALLAAAEGDRLGALFTLAVTSGMRQGELFALRWQDVDLTARTVSVTRSAQEIVGEVTFVEPKTATSRRRIELAQVAVDALVRRRALADREEHDSELVFPSPTGGVLRKSNFLRRVFFPLRAAAGLPATAKFHNLRHTTASLMLLQGASPKVVQEVLGHANPAVTMKTYSHVLPGLTRAAADRLDEVLLPHAEASIGGTKAVHNKKRASL
ncbi:MAG: tyrosine-type recombinase/integrase [Vulcanimicrobiaceae bacterium]